jgi:hypothetical protein
MMDETNLHLVELSSPFSRPAHFGLLELVVLACTVLVFVHALREYRRGDRRHLFQWLVITAYGLMMELIAFNFLHNYEHATFTVQLYHGKLPLYVSGLYGSFMYTGLKLAERLRVHPLIEALIAGFAMFLIDVPFDLAGVAVGWWHWLDVDPNLAYRWLGVPVTSYYWYLVFGAVAALECRVLWRRLEKRSFVIALPVALVAGFGVIFFGVLGFLPFHAIKALGVADGTIVAVHITACAALTLFAAKQKPGRLPREIATVVALMVGFHLVLLAWQGTLGHLADRGPRIAYAASASLGLIALIAIPLVRRSRDDEQTAGQDLPVSVR